MGSAQLATAQPETPSNPNLPYTFYSNSVSVDIPTGSTVTLSSSSDGTGSYQVDDKLLVRITNTDTPDEDILIQTFNSNKGTVDASAPTDVTSFFVGVIGRGSVTLGIDCTDLYPGEQSCSDIYLVWS